MSDIPINLNLDQCLIPTYSNHPRFADHAIYDPILRAFVLPDFVKAATKARNSAKKSQTPAKGRKRSKKDDAITESSTPEETPETLESDENYDMKFICEKAKSGISRCRKCGQSIAKDSLRFGYASPDPRGEYGAIPIWFHVRCAPLSFVGFDKFDDTLASMCFGFSALPENEKEEVAETAGKGMPIKRILNSEDAEEYGCEDFGEENLSERLVHRRGVSVPLLNTPSELTGATLLPFQREGFSWMSAQEANASTRGGILADEMGMGKTLQTIALILSKRELVRPTLVVCPVAAVMQWYSEIEKFTSNSNVLSVHVYHGSQKVSAEALAEFDVVLTTYQTLENDYRKESNKAKVKCKYCQKMFLPGKLSFHLKYMCGPDAMRTVKQSMREIKDKSSTEKAKKTMGIPAGPEPPTLTNVLKQVVKESGLVSGDQLEGMTHYDLMRLHRAAGSSETASELKKMKVTDLKTFLETNGVTNFPNRAKKQDLIKLATEKRLSVSGSPREESETSSESEESSSQDESEDSPVRKPKAAPRIKAESELKPGRRAAAMKAISALKSASNSDDENESEEEPVVEKKPKRTRPVSESSSEEDWGESSNESLEVSSSDEKFTESESSGESIDIGSDSEDEVIVKTKKKSGAPKRKLVAAPSQSAAKAEARKRASHGDKAEDTHDEAEDAIEDVDLSRSPLHCVKWGRLVLDEAHRIKQRTNSTSLAAFSLAADYRWCLSGTPLQNRVGELYSLVRFLRFSPFAHYFCKGCDCKSLHFRFIDNKFCQKCGCARTKHYSYFKQVISGPIIKFGIGDGSALNVLKTQVLDAILLRRTKLERQADLNLPPISVEIKKNKLTKEEFDFYESIYKQSILKFDTFAKSGTLLHNYAHIFDLLTRLRQALDHPYLIVYGADYSVPVAPANNNMRGICSLCQDDIGDEPRAVANCGHKYHSECVREYIKESPQLPTGGCGCPACFVPLTLVFEDDQSLPESPPEESSTGVVVTKKTGTILERVGAEGFQSSTKIEALIEELVKLEPESKVLIFSQFTRMLDLVEFRIKQNGAACAKLTGSQSLSQRNNIIMSFNSDPTMKALLISLKAGGEGLNLQAADHVFLIDPWWNPASELQAIQRAHRIGQTRPVKAVRFVTENSVEEKVVALQEMKQLVFDATVGQSQGAEKKLTESDLRFLFQH